jgi:iron complex transport system substrate-binding protein
MRLSPDDGRTRRRRLVRRLLSGFRPALQSGMLPAMTGRAPIRFLLLAFAALVATSGQAAHAETPPRRVVSFNVCTDQLVVALADADQIAGLSPYATDPTLSAVAEEARAFRRLEWHAESTIPLAPDLVLVGPRDRSVTQRLLVGLGFRVVEIPFVSTIAAAREQIRQVAAMLGHPERGEALLARLAAAQRRLAEAPRPPAATALLVERNGYSEGPTSLAAALMTEAGLKPPPGAPAGIGGYVALERLIVMHPDLLVLHGLIDTPRDQGSIYLTHPALAALYPPARRIVLPGRYTLCGGPGLVAGLDHLADEIARLAR